MALMTLLLGCSGGTVADSSPTDTGPACVYDGSDQGASPFDLPGVAACGAALFADACAACHGVDGSGSESGPGLGGHVPYHTDLEILTILLVGQGDMPAQGLSPQQHADLLAWLRATFGAYTGEGHPTDSGSASTTSGR